MKTLMLKPDIYNYDTAKEFAEDFMLGEGDLVVTNEYIYNPYFGGLNLKCDVIFQEKYGMGEPSDDMVEAMCRDIKGEHKRVIAIWWWNSSGHFQTVCTPSGITGSGSV